MLYKSELSDDEKTRRSNTELTNVRAQQKIVLITFLLIKWQALVQSKQMTKKEYKSGDMRLQVLLDEWQWQTLNAQVEFTIIFPITFQYDRKRRLRTGTCISWLFALCEKCAILSGICVIKGHCRRRPNLPRILLWGMGQNIQRPISFRKKKQNNV
jgi:hypothetical protein